MVKMRPQTTDYSLHVNAILENSCITAAREFLWDNYQALYSNGQPHVTLVFFPVKKNNFQSATERLRHFSKQQSPIEIRYDALSLEKSYFLYHIADEHLTRLHHQVLDLLSDLSIGLIRTKDQVRLSQGNYYSDQQIAMLNKYGYARAGTCFQPHISLGDLQNTSQLDMSKVQDDLLEILRGCDHTVWLKSVTISLLLDDHTQNQTESNLKTKTFNFHAI